MTPCPSREGRFCALPHSVALDCRLEADEVALVAYRALHVGAWRLHHRDVRKQLGIGKDRFYAIVGKCKELSYISREQTIRNGTFGRATETLNLAAAPPSRKGFQVVRQTLFDGTLNAKEIGLFLFISAHAANFRLTRHHVEKRFGWSTASVQRHARNLRNAGLLARGYKRVQNTEAQKLDTQSTDAQKPDTDSPAKFTHHRLRRTTRCNSEIVARFARDDSCEAKPAAGSTDHNADAIVAELRACDHARVLAPKLLTDAGRKPLLHMLDIHGPRVLTVIKARLAIEAIDGGRPSKIRGWRYFEAALIGEEKAEVMGTVGMRPGDAFSSWRDVAIEVPF